MFCFDLEATDGNNVFAMLIGRNQNAYIFSGSFDQEIQEHLVSISHASFCPHYT